MNNDEIAKIIETRRGLYIPTWAQLRSIGNSRAVQSTVLFPVIGYLILLSDQITDLFNGGLVPQHAEITFGQQLWNAKLHFVYFGLLCMGIGSAIYQWRCPRQIKKHIDWEDYVRLDGMVMHGVELEKIERMLFHQYGVGSGDTFGSSVDARRSRLLNRLYALISTDEWFSRLVTALMFLFGFSLLAIPSTLTVLKVLLSIR